MDINFTGQDRLNSIEEEGEGEKWAEIRDSSGHGFTLSECIAYDIA